MPLFIHFGFGVCPHPIGTSKENRAWNVHSVFIVNLKGKCLGVDGAVILVQNSEFDWRYPDVLKFNTKMIKQFMSDTSYFIVCEATFFGPYMTIIRPSYESSQ